VAHSRIRARVTSDTKTDRNKPGIYAHLDVDSLASVGGRIAAPDGQIWAQVAAYVGELVGSLFIAAVMERDLLRQIAGFLA
jgi:hypothetical protein